MTLRRAIVGILLLALALVLAAAVFARECPPLLAPAIWLVFLLAAFRFERQRYVAPGSPDGPWAPTGERFIDPTSGERLSVFVNAATGEREYRRLT